MKIVISALLILSAVHAQHVQFVPQDQPTLQPAPPRIETINSGYNIQHGDAQSSVDINFNSGETSSSENMQENSQGRQYLSELATQQYLNINPENIVAQPDQSYNVGYSINIAPKLSYRAPMPNPYSYRQQKLLNSDIITGTNKDTVEKPQYNSAPNYIPQHTPKPTITKVYGDVRNTHGYTWKSLSPGVEISGYHTLDEMSPQQKQKFDHAGALGRSQGFDISNVVGKDPETEKHHYLPQAQALTINKDFNTDDDTVDLKFEQQTYNQQPIDLKFEQNYNHQPNNFKQDLFSGGRIEYDKSLLEGFYKHYNPLFYSPEITLPAPSLPKNLHLNMHSSASNQLPAYHPINYNQNPHLNMINQHYAFVQANNDQLQTHIQEQLNSDVKPVTEQQEDSQVQQSQPAQTVTKLNDQKKYIPYRQYARPVLFEKNYRHKRFPPMIIIHQKY